MPKSRKAAPKSSSKELNKMAHTLDALAEFEQFREEILPALRNDLGSGLTAQQVYDKYQAYAAARGITIAMTSTKESSALVAIKDILDRTQGKAVERKIIAGKFDGLSDQDLRALVATEVDDE